MDSDNRRKLTDDDWRTVESVRAAVAAIWPTLALGDTEQTSEGSHDADSMTVTMISKQDILLSGEVSGQKSAANAAIRRECELLVIRADLEQSSIVRVAVEVSMDRKRVTAAGGITLDQLAKLQNIGGPYIARLRVLLPMQQVVSIAFDLNSTRFGAVCAPPPLILQSQQTNTGVGGDADNSRALVTVESAAANGRGRSATMRRSGRIAAGLGAMVRFGKNQLGTFKSYLAGDDLVQQFTHSLFDKAVAAAASLPDDLEEEANGVRSRNSATGKRNSDGVIVTDHYTLSEMSERQQQSKRTKIVA